MKSYWQADRINKMNKMGKTSCKSCLPRRSHLPRDEGWSSCLNRLRSFVPLLLISAVPQPSSIVHFLSSAFRLPTSAIGSLRNLLFDFAFNRGFRG